MSENAGRRATERVALDRLNDMLDERFPKSRLHVSRHGGRCGHNKRVSRQGGIAIAVIAVSIATGCDDHENAATDNHPHHHDQEDNIESLQHDTIGDGNLARTGRRLDGSLGRGCPGGAILGNVVDGRAVGTAADATGECLIDRNAFRTTVALDSNGHRGRDLLAGAIDRADTPLSHYEL